MDGGVGRGGEGRGKWLFWFWWVLAICRVFFGGGGRGGGWGVRGALGHFQNYFCGVSITKTCLYNFDPLKPQFYIVKLGFTRVYIIFLIFAQIIDCGYSLESPRRCGSNEYPQSMIWAENIGCGTRQNRLAGPVLTSTYNLWFEQKYANHLIFYPIFFSFWRWNFLYIWIGVFS